MLNKRLFLTAIMLSGAMGMAALAEQHEAVPADDPLLEEQVTDEAAPSDPMSEEQVTDEAAPSDPMSEEQLADETTPADLIIEEQAADVLIANTVMGTRVYNVNDEDVGRIEDLLIDGEGRLVGAVLSVGGFLGFGAKQIGVAWDKLSFHPLERIARLDANIDRAWLEEAPNFRTQEQIEAEQQSSQMRQQQLLEQERMQQQAPPTAQ